MAKGILLVALLACAGAVSALPLSLSDGIFTASGLVCGTQIVNEDANSMVWNDVSTAQGDCSSSGRIVHFQRATFSQFIHDDKQTIDAAWIENCAPNQAEPQPCSAWFYDPQSGALQAQPGDQIDYIDRITVTSSASFQLDEVETWGRAGAVLHSNADGQTIYNQVP